MKRKLASVFLTVVLAASPAFAADHDADGIDDLTVYRQSEGNWFVSSTAQASTFSYAWGLNGDYPVSGKYTSTSGADLAVWRPSTGIWYLRHYDVGLNFSSASAYQWGLPSDKPYPCDFDGDGLNDLAVFRNSSATWYVRNSGGSFNTANQQQWGLPGDTPVPADYDADGTCDYTTFRNGSWFVILSSTSGTQAGTIAWGSAGDTPVPGLYRVAGGSSDSIRDFAVFRPQTSGFALWLVRLSNLAGLTSRTLQWGLNSDLPVPGDYDGDGITDIAVWRPSTGIWYIRTSASDYASSSAFQFGLNGDIPMGDRRGKNPS